MNDRITAVDLFAGGGGASLGIEQAGAELLAAVDRKPAAVATHRANLGGVHIQHDLRNITPGVLPPLEIDYVHGSPPCQGFSQAGGERSRDDPQNTLVWRFIDWVDQLKPRAVTMENVPGMSTISNHFMDRVSAAFREAGYETRWRELNAADYGVPQRRKRVFVVGFRMDQPLPSEWFPRPTHAPERTVTLDGDELAAWQTVREAIGDLEAAATDGGHVPNHEPQNHADETRARLQTIPPGETNGTTSNARVAPDEPSMTITSGNGTPPVHYQGGHVPDHVAGEPSCTVTTRGYLREGGHHESLSDSDVRRLTVREAARLQSFPDWFVFKGGKEEQYRQVGNAVPPRLQRHLVEHIAKALK